MSKPIIDTSSMFQELSDADLIAAYILLSETWAAVGEQRRAITAEINARAQASGGTKLATASHVATISNSESYELPSNADMTKLRSVITATEFEEAFKPVWKPDKRGVDRLLAYGGEIAAEINSIIIRRPKLSVKISERGVIESVAGAEEVTQNAD